MFVFSEPAWRYLQGNGEDFSKEGRFLDSLLACIRTQAPVTDTARFKFDPNTSTADDLRQLGFSPEVSRRIRSYVTKGGRFRAPDDLLKIYGVDSVHVEGLRPWINIVPDRAVGRFYRRPQSSPKQFAQKHEPFDLNLADTIQLKRVRGIGSKLSQRITRYREALGGFYNENQLFEVFKLDSSVVRDLQATGFISRGFTPRTMSINSAEQSELAGHPYISPREAAAIVAYRFTHGKFAAIEDLEKAARMDSLRLSRVKPYLTIE